MSANAYAHLSSCPVEFYFSDANLPFDKFLFTLSRKNADGWVPLATLASFKRMKPMRDVLDDAELAAALRSSEAVEVDEPGTHVRRRVALAPVKDAFQRSAYAVSDSRREGMGQGK